jgi:hypothetical protein
LRWVTPETASPRAHHFSSARGYFYVSVENGFGKVLVAAALFNHGRYALDFGWNIDGRPNTCLYHHFLRLVESSFIGTARE